MPVESVRIPRDSRYKDTPLFRGPRGIEYEIFHVPREFEDVEPDANRHTVKQDEVGFLDAIAFEWYGEGNEVKWWIIALTNRIIDPEREMFPGQVLLIPRVDTVQEFVSRSEANG